MMNFLLMLTSSVQSTSVQSTGFCATAGVDTVMSLAGVVISVIKIGVPVILVIVGMVDFAKASASKDEDTIKKAQKLLGKKAIVGLMVYLVPTIVTLLMSVIGNSDWKACTKCINSPWTAECIKSVGSSTL